MMIFLQLFFGGLVGDVIGSLGRVGRLLGAWWIPEIQAVPETNHRPRLWFPGKIINMLFQDTRKKKDARFKDYMNHFLKKAGGGQCRSKKHGNTGFLRFRVTFLNDRSTVLSLEVQLLLTLKLYRHRFAGYTPGRMNGWVPTSFPGGERFRSWLPKSFYGWWL